MALLLAIALSGTVAAQATPPAMGNTGSAATTLTGAPASEASSAANALPILLDPGTKPPRPEPGAIRAIRFLTDDDYPPFHFIGANGQLQGFNIDIARALCAELGAQCTIQPRRWDTLIPSLQAREGDAVIASLAISEAQRRLVDFSLPYYRTPARFVVRDSGAPPALSPAALSGVPIGVVARTAHAAYLETFFPGAAIRPFGDLDVAQLALRDGAVSALFGDGVTLARWLGTERGRCCRFAGAPYLDSRFFGEGVGIAFRKDSAVLRRAVDYALHRLIETGVYKDLYLKYFPVGFY